MILEIILINEMATLALKLIMSQLQIFVIFKYHKRIMRINTNNSVNIFYNI